MSKITDRLERMTAREKVVETATKEISGGEIWVSPIELKKGLGYSLSARSKPKAVLLCALFNGSDKVPIAKSEIESKATLSVIAEESGKYKLVVTSLHADSRPRKVTFELRESYTPSRVKAWAYPMME